jgi:hypothetical protein
MLRQVFAKVNKALAFFMIDVAYLLDDGVMPRPVKGYI